MYPKRIMPLLSDDQLLMALGVCKERLADPARWCREVRAHGQAIQAGPKTVWLVEILREWRRRLGEEAYGPWPEPECRDPQSD